MPALLDADSLVLPFKEQDWLITREATYEWAINEYLEKQTAG